jgi:hypothetical protein
MPAPMSRDEADASKFAASQVIGPLSPDGSSGPVIVMQRDLSVICDEAAGDAAAVTGVTKIRRSAAAPPDECVRF